jgi:predicted HTH transcriptional regulator
MIEDEIAAGESNRLEFKEKIPKDPKKYVKSAIALSNSQGGKIIFGVADDGKIVGMEGDLSALRDQIIDEIAKDCVPQINANSYMSSINGKNIIVIDVVPGISRPYYLKSEGMVNGTYVRISASTRAAGPETLKDLILEGTGKSYDGLDYIDENHRKISMESVNKLCSYLSERSKKEVSITDIVGLNIIRVCEGEYVPSRAFMLLTDNPYDHARIQCARFKGPDELEFMDRKEFTGSIIKQVDEAVGFVFDHTNFGAKIKGLYRIDLPEIPIEAVREIVTNAVLHRSYSMDSSPIFVAVYDDRIEITSPGMMPLGLTIDDAMAGRSNPRNKVIAKFFREANLMEGWGRGIRRSFSLCEEFKLRPPSFKRSEMR